MEQKKSIKIKFLDYWSDFPTKMDSYLVLRLLRRHFDVQVCEDADYVFFSAMGDSHWSVPDRCVKIFHTGENLVPDFNACDYALGFDLLEFGDRYLRCPLYLFYDSGLLDAMEHKHELPDGWSLEREKPDFCSFVVSNPDNAWRNGAFGALSRYKKVDSGGRYSNNVGGPVADKFAFECSHKFSLCCENTSYPGYTTEKLVEAFAARTVPVYWGDPGVAKVFNPRAFIDATSCTDYAELVQRVEALDRDDEAYLRTLREPALLPGTAGVADRIGELESWLLHIFNQPLESAYRRNRVHFGRYYIEKRLVLDPKANRKALWETGLRKIKGHFGKK